MKCPYCGGVCADNAVFCPNCKQPLAPREGRPAGAEPLPAKERRSPAQWVLTVFAALAFVIALSVGAYKLVRWIDDYQLNRLYTRGAYTPRLSLVQMDDLRQGHAVIFYGKDGDQIYVPELNRSLSISGGVARMEIADSDWFNLTSRTWNTRISRCRRC